MATGSLRANEVSLPPDRVGAEPGDGSALRAIARAIELQQNGRLDEAEAVYARLLRDADRDPTVLINAGALALARRDVRSAVERLERAVAIVPRNAIAHANLGFALHEAGRADDALRALDIAVALKPDFAQAHNNRGVVLVRMNRRADARRAFEQALSILPAHIDAALNLGELANRDGDPAAARAAYERVLARDPGHAIALTGIAYADALEGRLGEAAGSLQALVKRDARSAATWQTLGAVLNWAGGHDEAEAAFRRALAVEPAHRDAQFGVASALLARGRYAEGFAAFEASRSSYVPATAALARLAAWNGGTLDATLVLHGEQGLGDVVQFARFVTAIRERVPRVVAFLEPYWAPLAPLLASLQGVDAIMTDEASISVEAPAVRCSFLTLAAFAGATPDTLPQPPYLSAEPERVSAWRSRVDRTARVRAGLAWSVHARDDHAFVSAHKSVSPAALLPLLDVADVAFHAVQPGDAGDPAVFGARSSRVAATGRAIADFGDTAALIENLDVVVTPDTAVAHVAGALGKPVLLLERLHGCWRWRLAPSTSPWYPSLTILRQRRFNDWTAPVLAAADVLRAWPAAAR